jgi:alpha-tubulin suppressor-like RCC1 family protein
MLAWLTPTPARRPRSLRFLTSFALLIAILIGPACHDTTAPTRLMEMSPSYIIVSGNGQVGTAGVELPFPIVAKATNSSSTPLVGVTVFFVVTQGGGHLYAGGGVTDAAGSVQDYWTLGQTAGPQRVEVRAVDPTTGQKISYATFTAGAGPGAAAIMKVSAGDGQAAFTRASLPVKAAVLVTDTYGNPVPGISVAFAVTAGGGGISASPVVTDASGVAALAGWRLGYTPGPNKVTATKTGLTGSPVTFTATSRFGLASVVAGEAHSCGLDAANDVYCWGANGIGELGDGTLTERHAPVRISGAGLATSLAIGTDHTCVLVAGKAKCVGGNFYGTLGNGTNTESSVYVAVSGSQTFTTISAAKNSTCGLTSAGSVYCWGQNGDGEFGNGTGTNSNVPVLSAGGLTFKSVYRGGYHTCALTAAGSAWCWGYNYYGQLGNGNTTISLSPVAVIVPSGVTFASLELGTFHTCGLTPDGTAYCWGWNYWNQVDGSGIDILSPTPILGGLKFKQLAAGGAHTCGITLAGLAYCWGYNGRGTAGIGAASTANLTVPTVIAGGHAFSAISAGTGDYTCALPVGGGLPFCWGSNSYGQVGNGTILDPASPVEILTPPIP